MGDNMTTPSPFEVARGIGNNFGQSFKRVQDENVIDKVLAEAMNNPDPSVLQQSIGQILSSVSPERQGPAVQFIQNRMQSLQKNKEQQAQFQREEKAGLVPGINPTAQTAIYKEKAKGERLSKYGLGSPQQGQESVPQESVFTKLTDDQLVVASGAPDREVAEPAKAELKRRDEERKISQKKEEGKIKIHTDISQDIIKENEKEAQGIIQKKSALELMKQAIASKDLSFFSTDNLADITGLEAFRSPEGALFKTAAKEFFLGSLTRSGARPNQFLEKQIVEMLPKMGRSTAANLSVTRAFENEIDLQEAKIRITRELADELENKLGYVPRNLGQLRDERLKIYAENKQKELNNDLRAYKSIEEKTKQPYMKVEPGTPISKVVSKAILDQFDKKDPDRVKKAEVFAKELGYTF